MYYQDLSCLFSQPVFLRNLSLLLSLFFLGCAQDDQVTRKGGESRNSILAELQGATDSENLSGKLSQLDYFLICESAKDIKGEKVKSSSGSDILINFPGSLIKDGEACAVEFRGDLRKGVAWLSNPQKPGLYYASNKRKVDGRKLKLNLYKVYKASAASERESENLDTDSRSNPSDNIEAILVNSGECSDFDLETRECLSAQADTGIAPECECPLKEDSEIDSAPQSREKAAIKPKSSSDEMEW